MTVSERLSLKQLVYAALTGAISYVLMTITSFPIFLGAPFLKVDLSEIPLLVITVLISPSIGFLALITKDTLFFLLTGANIFGIFADIIAGGIFIYLFGTMLRKKLTASTVTLAGAIAVFARLAVVVPINLVVLYLEFGMTPAAVMKMMPYILPFNLIKSVIGILGFSMVFLRYREKLLGMIR